MSQLRAVTCHMGSHSVTCRLTQVNTSRLNHSQTGWYLIYLPRRDRRLNWPRWLVTWAYWDGLPTQPGPVSINHYCTLRRHAQFSTDILVMGLFTVVLWRAETRCSFWWEQWSLDCRPAGHDLYCDRHTDRQTDRRQNPRWEMHGHQFFTIIFKLA